MATAIEALRTLNAQESPLLAKLPADLRNEVYKLVLVCEAEIEIDYADLHKRTGLLRTSLQLREEASKVSFGENDFGISDAVDQTEDVHLFLRSFDTSPTGQSGVFHSSGTTT